MGGTTPSRLMQGITWSWTRTDLSSTYPNDEWTLAYTFTSIDPIASFTLNAVNDGGAYKIEQTAAQTAALVPSDRLRGQSGYHYQAVLTRTSDGEKAFASRGQLDVGADLAAAPVGYDPRSAAQVLKANLLKAIDTLRASPMKSYSMPDGRSVVYQDLGALVKELHNIDRQIELEAKAADLGSAVSDMPSGRYRVRFS